MGRVHDYIVSKILSGEKLHFTLVDPERVEDLDRLIDVTDKVVSAGTDGFLIGGSLAVTPEEADATVKTLKKYGLPVVIFPGNVNCLTPNADAVLFMVLMNTLEPYYLMQVQVLAAPIIVKYGLEALPTGYVVVDQDSAVAHVGRAYPVPRNKPEIIAAYAMAAQMLGFKYMYIEAGSGAQQPVPSEFPYFAKKYAASLVIMVGGGIRSPEVAKKLAESGADIIVTGTVVEKDPQLAARIVKSIKGIQGSPSRSDISS
ncbi:MAG: geranylgeranylglyceryl/heptaprenylglyceryl phosphate synthase [Desulfurococcaceae archaeon]